MAANLFPSRSSARTCFTAAVCFTLLASLVLAAPEILATASVPAPATAPKAAATVPSPAPAPKVLTLHEKVVNSLRAAGRYGAVSGLLDSLSDNIIKEGITLFAPDDSAFSGIQMNSSSALVTTLNYHVATRVYSYQDLTNLPLGTKIPTAAAGVNIVVTSVAKGGYRLDNAGIIDPDLYSDGTVSVQGLNAVLDTAAYNKGVVPPEAAPAPMAADTPAPGVASPAATTTPAAGTSNPNAAAHTKTGVLISAIAVSAASMVIASL